MPGGERTTDETNHIWSRRDILSVAAGGAVLSMLGVATLAIVRMLFPRVLFEPPTSFKAGYPKDYITGMVDDRWIKSQRVWVIRNEQGFYALIAICTHLGCTPRWLGPENKFKCPCHGSGYTKDGINFEGPTPRPLERAKIKLADDGQLLVDKAFRYRWELGQWDNPEAFLKFTS